MSRSTEQNQVKSSSCFKSKRLRIITFIVFLSLFIAFFWLITKIFWFYHDKFVDPSYCNACSGFTSDANKFNDINYNVRFQGTLKVVTLNMNSEPFLVDQNFLIRDIRFQSLINWIKTNDPDILLLQEVWNYRNTSSVVINLSKALGNYDCHQYLDLGIPFTIYDGNAVMVKKIHKMHSVMQQDLPGATPYIGDSKNWLMSFGPRCNVVGVKIFPNGSGHPDDATFVYCTHVLYSTPEYQQKRLVALSNYIQNHISSCGHDPKTANVIIGGDFNLEVSNIYMQDFVQDLNLTDCWTETTHDSQFNSQGITYSGDKSSKLFNPCIYGAGQFPNQSDEYGNIRIDLIFSRGDTVTPLESIVDFQYPIDHIFQSDHYGVVAVFGNKKLFQNNYIATLSDSEKLDVLAIPQLIVLKSNDDNDNAENNNNNNNNQVITVSNYKGLTVQNQSPSSQNVYVEIYGPGPIFSTNQVTLKVKKIATFTFLMPGTYTLNYAFSQTSNVKITKTIQVETGM